MAIVFSASVLIASCLLLQLAGGKDLYWQPNSNWGTPSNWALGRIPACGDKASLASVPSDGVVYLDTDIKVRSLSLPTTGRLVISPSVTIRLSSEEECTVPVDTEPMAAGAPVENEFTGARVNYWECPNNWLTEDNFPADHAPCGDDRAIFGEGRFFYVKANDSIFVRSLRVRGQQLQSHLELTPPEFDLKIQINSECGEDPSLCPCPMDSKCPKPEAPSVGIVKGSPNTGPNSSPNTGAIAGGTVFAILVVVAIVIVVAILVVVLVLRRRSSINYMKDDLIDESDLGASPSHATGDSAFDNPVYDEIKIDLGAEMTKTELKDVPMPEVSVNPDLYPPDDEDTKKAPKLNEYERI